MPKGGEKSHRPLPKFAVLLSPSFLFLVLFVFFLSFTVCLSITQSHEHSYLNFCHSLSRSQLSQRDTPIAKGKMEESSKAPPKHSLLWHLSKKGSCGGLRKGNAKGFAVGGWLSGACRRRQGTCPQLYRLLHLLLVVSAICLFWGTFTGAHFRVGLWRRPAIWWGRLGEYISLLPALSSVQTAKHHYFILLGMAKKSIF